jgi:hypothetical protein
LILYTDGLVEDPLLRTTVARRTPWKSQGDAQTIKERTLTSMLRRLAAGAVAGAAGTLAMDLLLYRRYRDGGGDEGFADWELSTSTASFEEAGAPGKVAKKAAEAMGVELPDAAAGPATDVVHWLTGIGHGLAHAVVQHRRHPVLGGAVTGAGAFGSSYVLLGAIGVYEPIWTYDADTLGEDLSAHLLFGLVVGLVYRAIAPR